MPNETEKNILAAITTVALSILALPVVFVKAAFGARKLARAAANISAGSMTCPYCGTVNPLNCMARCPTCAAVAPGSRLYCPFCKNVYTVIPCAGCGATLKVLP